jgi:hypothetical protein
MRVSASNPFGRSRSFALPGLLALPLLPLLLRR